MVVWWLERKLRKLFALSGSLTLVGGAVSGRCRSTGAGAGGGCGRYSFDAGLNSRGAAKVGLALGKAPKDRANVFHAILQATLSPKDHTKLIISVVTYSNSHPARIYDA